MKTKFTSDGKKVAVIGQLNQTEWIVQEIFVTEDGDELPQGEKFTTKTLLDKPNLSYRDKELMRLEENIDKNKSKLKSLSAEISSLIEKRRALSELFKQSNCALKNIENFDFDFFCDVASVNFEWFVKISYNGRINLITNDETDVFCVFNGFYHHSNNKFESIRLVSLLGKSDGDFTYKLNQYSDTSGSCNDDYVFFKSKEDMFDWITNYLAKLKEKEQVLSMGEYRAIKKVGYDIPQIYISDAIEHTKKSKQIQLDNYNEKLIMLQSGLDAQISELEQELNGDKK